MIIATATERERYEEILRLAERVNIRETVFHGGRGADFLNANWDALQLSGGNTNANPRPADEVTDAEIILWNEIMEDIDYAVLADQYLGNNWTGFETAECFQQGTSTLEEAIEYVKNCARFNEAKIFKLSTGGTMEVSNLTIDRVF